MRPRNASALHDELFRLLDTPGTAASRLREIELDASDTGSGARSLPARCRRGARVPVRHRLPVW